MRPDGRMKRLTIASISAVTLRGIDFDSRLNVRCRRAFVERAVRFRTPHSPNAAGRQDETIDDHLNQRRDVARRWIRS